MEAVNWEGGHSVQVVSFTDPDAPDKGNGTARRLKLNAGILREIAAKAEDWPIAIIAIAGAGRRGKSFILSYLVRYLLALTAKSTATGDGRREHPPDWLSDSKASMKEGGFQFQSGTTKVTNGIWMWSEPFVVENGGSKMAILVMDTEGCFDRHTRISEQFAIISLSLLISSSFIFNETTDINENTLLTLGNFMSYGQAASQLFSGSACFQRVTFLVRDWYKPDFPHGVVGGRDYRNAYMTPDPTLPPEAIRIRESLHKYFEDIDCYLMPPPGDEVHKAQFSGSVDEMGPEYSKHVAKFVKGLVDDASPKKIASGTSATGRDLFTLFSYYFDVLNDHDAPDASHFFMASQGLLYETKVTKFKTQYQDRIMKKIGDRLFIPLSELSSIHTKIGKSVLHRFDKILQGFPEKKPEFRVRLRDAIEQIFEEIRSNMILQEERLVEKSEESAVTDFKNQLERCLSEQYFWELTDFRQLVERQREETRKDFLTMCRNPPDDSARAFVQHLFDQLTPHENTFWDAVESRRIEAESKIGDLLHDAKQDQYVELMQMETGEDYIPPAILQQKHEKHKEGAMKVFHKQLEDYPQTFFEKFTAQLATDIEQESEQFFSSNFKKLEAVVTRIENQVGQVIQKFDDEVTTILKDFGPASATAVQQAHQRDKKEALELVDQNEDMDAAEFNKLKGKINDALEQALEKALGQVNHLNAEMNRECEDVVQSLVRDCFKHLESFDAQECYFNPKIFGANLEQFRTTARSNLNKALMTKFKLSGEQIEKYLTRFHTLVEDPMAELTKLNILKSQTAFEKGNHLVGTTKKKHWDHMTQFLERANTSNDILRELEETHKGLVDAALKDFEHEDIWNKEDAGHFKEELVRDLDQQLDKVKGMIEMKLKKLKMLADAVDEFAQKFKQNISHIVTSNPFCTDAELINHENRVSNQVLADFVRKLSTEDPQNSQFFGRDRNIAQDMEKALDAAKIEIQPKLQKEREKARNQVEELIVTWVNGFDNQLNLTAVKEQNFETTIKEIQNQNQNLQQNVLDFFERDWRYDVGSPKEKYLTDLRNKMEQIFNKIHQHLLTQQHEAHTQIQILVTYSTIPFQTKLDQGKAFDSPTLRDQLTRMVTETRREFEESLKSMNILPTCALPEFEKQSQVKMNFLLELNDRNCDLIKGELTDLVTRVLQEGKDGARSEPAIQELVQKAVGQAEKLVEGRQAELTQEVRDLRDHMTTTVEGLHKSILIELQRRSEMETPGLFDTGIARYEKEMKKYLKGKKAVPAMDLEKFQELSVQSALDQLRNRSFVGNALETAILAELDHRFRIKRDEHDLERGNQAKTTAIGIDLGTTTCCVAVYENGEAVVIKDTIRSAASIENSDQSIGPPKPQVRQERVSRVPVEESSLIDSSSDEEQQPIPIEPISIPLQPTCGQPIQPRVNVNLTPSYVQYPLTGGVIVGVQAKESVIQYPENTVHSVKRLMGRQYDDPEVKKDKKYWPFTISKDVKKMAEITINGRSYSPVQVSAELLKHEKQVAEDYLKREVTQAVITVPATFDFNQRDATARAAQLAGLEVLQIIDEPTAAAMAHALHWNHERRTVLVFDFGGGTLDVSILSTGHSSTDDSTDQEPGEVKGRAPNLRVLLSRGDSHLGGEDFDANLATFCVQEFEQQHEDKLLEESEEPGDVGHHSMNIQRRKIRLWTQCERVKELLTTQEVAKVIVTGIINRLDLEVTISREKFEELNQHLFQRAIDLVQETLRAANISNDQINHVIMVGGSSKIPRIQSMLKECLQTTNLTVDATIDVQEAVARGAALQACIRSGGTASPLTRTLPVMQDLQPFSIGIEKEGGQMSVIIQKGSLMPCSGFKTYRANFENDVDVIVYGGDKKFVADNRPLCCFTLAGGVTGSQEIKIAVHVDNRGFIRVIANCEGMDISRELTVDPNRPQLREI